MRKRIYKFNPVKTGCNGAYEVRLWRDGDNDHLSYELVCKIGEMSKVMFRGDQYRPSMLIDEFSRRSAADLLLFLCEPYYENSGLSCFEGYTEAQIAWSRSSEAEMLGYYAIEYSEGL